MPYFHRKGAAWRFHPQESDPNGAYAKSLPGYLQKKLEALPPPQKVTTLAEMSPEKQAAIKALYANGPTRKR